MSIFSHIHKKNLDCKVKTFVDSLHVDDEMDRKSAHKTDR